MCQFVPNVEIIINFILNFTSGHYEENAQSELSNLLFMVAKVTYSITRRKNKH